MGAVVHKRVGVGDPAQQWVTMTLADLVTILSGQRPSPHVARTEDKARQPPRCQHERDHVGQQRRIP